MALLAPVHLWAPFIISSLPIANVSFPNLADHPYNRATSIPYLKCSTSCPCLQITPVALLAPVALGGVTIRRASMHNVGQALGLGLHLGDAVVLRRSGDVIPQVCISAQSIWCLLLLARSCADSKNGAGE